jgi:hypothetical protein
MTITEREVNEIGGDSYVGLRIKPGVAVPS